MSEPEPVVDAGAYMGSFRDLRQAIVDADRHGVSSVVKDGSGRPVARIVPYDECDTGREESDPIAQAPEEYVDPYFRQPYDEQYRA